MPRISCEFCKISKNTLFYRTPLVAASVTSYVALDCDFEQVVLSILNLNLCSFNRCFNGCPLIGIPEKYD